MSLAIFKRTILTMAMLFIAYGASAQGITLYSGGEPVLGKSVEEVDSIIFDPDYKPITYAPIDSIPSDGKVIVDAHWCALGTSITWYNDHVDVAEGRFSKGYPTRVLEKIAFTSFTNRGESGATIHKALAQIIPADYYTVEFGINDWGRGVPPGTFDDYKTDSNNGTFAAIYRRLIDEIYTVSPDAMVVLCTPRKGYGFNGYLPESWDLPLNGVYLREYVDVIRQIAEYEGLPLADFFAECGGRRNLRRLSIDDALHPNDDGYQLMANVLVKALEKVLIIHEEKPDESPDESDKSDESDDSEKSEGSEGAEESDE